MNIPISIIMGSKSDWATMKKTADVLDQFGVAYEKKVVSAHRTPDLMFKHAEEARARGIKVIIAGAGGAAHLPGMVAAKTTLPVIGVPVQSRALSGLDSLYSIVQMPGGVPVATMAIGEAGATNAALTGSPPENRLPRPPLKPPPPRMRVSLRRKECSRNMGARAGAGNNRAISLTRARLSPIFSSRDSNHLLKRKANKIIEEPNDPRNSRKFRRIPRYRVDRPQRQSRRQR